MAVGLARLGLRVSWLSRVGADSFGDFVRRTIEREGVDCASVSVDTQRPTGFMLKSRASGGQDPTIEYFRKGSAASALSLAERGRRIQLQPGATGAPQAFVPHSGKHSIWPTESAASGLMQ